jgi:peptidoglycan/xylan/chitin deacetylase (PgdA/CDA1 family)
MRYKAKVILAHLLYALGLLQLWQRIKLNRRAVVLMYHRVLPSEERRQSGSHPAIMVDPDTFDRQMGVVKHRFKVLSLEEFADRIERKVPFENSSCLITFDDGWKDNVTHALPILKKHELSAVVFLPVNYIGEKRLFWQEALVHLLGTAINEARRDPARAARIHEIVAPLGLEEILSFQDDDPRQRVMELISRKRKTFEQDTLDMALAGLRSELCMEGADANEIDSFLDWEDVERMSRRGIQFGGHGAEHRLLSEMSVEEAREDITLSKDVIDLRVKPSILTFSYPRGYWTPQVASLVKASGFRLAFLAKGGSVTSEDDPYTLRRINIAQDGTETTPMFLARVVGLF